MNDMPNGRTRGITAAIEGCFALGWFGWTGASAPSWLALMIAVASVAGGLVVVAGIALIARTAGQDTPRWNPAVRRGYLNIVGTEFGLLIVGAAILSLASLTDWIPVWICAGVGLHFLPLARVLGDPALIPLGVLITAAAAAALIVGLLAPVAPTLVTGPAAGGLLLAAAIVALGGRPRLHDPAPSLG